MSRGWFITGTDTGVGKTFVAQALLRGLRLAGRAAVGMKPVATGCRTTHRGLRSEDAECLQAASTVECDYADVNPYAFAEPIAPHLAAAATGTTIDVEEIRARFERLRRCAPWVVVEGIGGWCVPIDRERSMAAVAAALELPVILVVGLRLGCINHALLTAAAIPAEGARFAGWVANPIAAELPRLDDMIESLAGRLPAPLIGVMPRARSGEPLPSAMVERLVNVA